MSESAWALSWDDFRLIEAIARARTLPSAASLLGIDHSTVFRRLRQIERALGTPLFERHRSGYALTAVGEEITALAQRVDEDITGVLRRISGQAPSPAGEVRLATSDSLLGDLLAPLLVRFRGACPLVRLDVVTANAEANLSRRDADVAVRATDAPPETLVGRRVGRIAWALYGLRSAYAAAEAAPWVAAGDAMAAIQAARYVREKVEPARVVARFDTVGGITAAVESGLGIGHLPCFAGDIRPSLARLAEPDEAFATDLWLLTHPDLRQAPRVRVLLDFLAGEIATLRDLIEGRRPKPAAP